MKVIATAGHVDHGKSALVEALTGIHPDRLAEEQARGMTIDLGFAWMDLPTGEAVGIVDVPGHIDFIHNMLAGVGGIDAALFVVAADEGVMPQTREHLDILDLLEVERGVVALTKTDLIDDPDWLALVEEEVRDLLAPTRPAAAPIVPVSAHTGAGLDALRQALATVLAAAPPRPDLGRPRLPIDRVFTIAGFGTVVTGTLVDGSLRLGDEVVIVPGGIPARIRGLQTHKKKREVAVPGSRVAVNLTGVRPDQIERGRVLTYPNLLRETLRVDVRLRVLADAPAPLRHNMVVTFHSAAAETAGRLRLLEADELPPGATGWAQIELQKPLALARGDHFIVRRPSPSQTLGGGVVLDPTPQRRHRRRRTEVIAHFERLWQGTPADLLEDLVARLGPLPAAQALTAVALPIEQAQAALVELQAAGRVQLLDPADPTVPLITPAGWEALRRHLTGLLGDFHQANPLRLGMAREEVKSRLQPRGGWSTRLFNAIVARAVAEGAVREVGTLLALPDFRPRFTPAQQAAVDGLLAQFQAAPFNPPAARECIEAVGEEVFNALLEQQVLVRVASDVVFARPAYEEMVAGVRRYMDEHGRITVAECRDLFGTSRKYALALLEYLDQMRVTRREGDVRVRW
ncbi:MAG: selenocysteine-specific translation elongation factor [Anaerolineae bacterium]|nr:selenocysteine-specific translation elongation factor [Anaerolineae bacterium]